MGFSSSKKISGSNQSITRMTTTGRPYRYWEPASKFTFRRAELSIPAAMPFPFILEIEGKWQVVAKALRFAGEFQTGDKMFDDRVYILSDSPQLAKKLTEDARMRQIVMNFFDWGVESMYAADGRLTVIFRTHSRQMDEESIEEFVRILDEINRKFSVVPEAISYSTRPEQYANIFGIVMEMIFATGLIGVAACLLKTGFVNPKPIAVMGLAYGAIIIALLLLFIRWATSKSAYGYQFARSIVLFGAPGIIFWSMTLLYLKTQ